MSDIVLFTQTTPATPGSGKADIFVDSSTKQIKSVNDAGAVAVYLTEAGHNVAAAVHGLPASVNVLGNRGGVGEFIQWNATPSVTPSTLESIYSVDQAVTYPVAFTAINIVFVGGTGSTAVSLGCAYSITTTGFTARILDNVNYGARQVGWIALGK